MSGYRVEELVAAILPKLERVNGPGGSGNYSAQCPFHDDRHASFSIHAKGGLWQCHAAGCGRQGNAYQLAEELGITRGESSTPCVDWGLDAAMERYGITVHQRGVIFPVIDHAGNRGRNHVRLHQGEPRFQYWGRGKTLHALVAWDLVREWGSGCGIAYVIEGNRDWLALVAHGWPAIGILGVDHFGAAREETFEHLRAAGIGALVLTPDNDTAGQRTASDWPRVLRRDGFQVGIRTLPTEASGRPVKDVFDLFRAVGSDFESWLHELPVDWSVSCR